MPRRGAYRLKNIAIPLCSICCLPCIDQPLSCVHSKPAPIEMTCADFDGVIFHLFSPPEDKNVLNLSLQASAFNVINKYGLAARLKNIYGNYLAASPESGFNVTLTVNTTQLPQNAGTHTTHQHTLRDLLLSTSIPHSGSSESFHLVDNNHINLFVLSNSVLPTTDELAFRFALLKRHVYAQPFEYVFEQIDQGKAVSEIIDIPYRGEERTFITSQGKDRVTVVYSINFKDKDDVILGKVFMSVRANVERINLCLKKSELTMRGCANCVFRFWFALIVLVWRV